MENQSSSLGGEFTVRIVIVPEEVSRWTRVVLQLRWEGSKVVDPAGLRPRPSIEILQDYVLDLQSRSCRASSSILNRDPSRPPDEFVKEILLKLVLEFLIQVRH